MPLPKAPEDLARVLLEDQQAQVVWSAQAYTPAPVATGTYYYWMGSSLATGLVLVDVHVLSSDAIAKSATDYYTFRVVMSVPDGNAQRVESIGVPRATNMVAMAANVPMRCHEQTHLNKHVPANGVVGVRLDVTTDGGIGQHYVSFVARLRKV